MTTNKYKSVSTPAKVRLVQNSGNDMTVVRSARVSLASLEEMHSRNYLDSTPSERDIRLINYLAKHKHMSPFEHCHITFWVEAPLYISKQHMRHRTWSYNEVSRRYTSEDIRIYEPPFFRAQAKKNLQASTDEEINPVVMIVEGSYCTYETYATDAMKRNHLECVKLYETLLDAGVCREQARGVLPNNLMTQYYATVNLRNVVAFLRERLGEGAQYEIRELAKQMASIVRELYPISYGALMENNNV
tara:strand:- start:4196 stop:4933 length:738 start_codon:yes stop_codon:yes gene_type:complete